MDSNARVGPRTALVLALALYAAFATLRGRADRPMADEAWFASPAWNLARHGSMHTSVLESRGTYWEGIDRYTYWIPPAYPVMLAGWFKLAGQSLFAMRALSAVFGCAVVLAIFLIVSRITPDRWAPPLASLFVASDFALIRAGALGRMDGMCAAFGFGGLAVYLLLRERRVRLALVAGHALVAVSVFTHPNGALYFLALTITALWWDRGRLRLPHAAAALLPYVVLLALWGAYIAQEPHLFRRQFGGNTSRRFRGLAAPLAALWREISLRYLAGRQTALRIVLLLPYVVGIGAGVSVTALRRQRGVRLLLVLIGVFFLTHWLFEAVKLYFYAVHLTPIGMALFAIAIRWACHGSSSRRAAASLVAGLLILVHLAGTAFTIRRASYRTTYLPLVEYLRTQTQPDDLVMGSAELAFGLGFDANLIDDVRLGYHSGQRPDFIVLDARYKETQTTHLPEEHPLAAHHVTSMLPAYERVFSIGDYDVLAGGKRGTGASRGQAP